MNKSILFFIGGSVFGAVSSVLLLSSPALDTGSIDSELDKISSAIQNLNTTTTKLNALVETYTYVLPSQPQPTAGPSNLSNSNDAPATEMYAQNIQPENTQNFTEQPAAASTGNKPVKETPVQIEQYQSIESQLLEASNNHSIILTDLIKESGNLSESQRQELTNRAMQMIEKGELKIEQFMQ